LLYYDGTYRLQRRDDETSKPIGKWACAWRLRIIDLSLSRPDVKHLKPIIVVATQTGEGLFKTTCAESLGRKICGDFNLDVNEILWIEHFPSKLEQMYVAVFTPKHYIGPELFYNIDWRPIRSNELETIRLYIPESDTIQGNR
jgi:hypothetical protein